MLGCYVRSRHRKPAAHNSLLGAMEVREVQVHQADLVCQALHHIPEGLAVPREYREKERERR